MIDIDPACTCRICLEDGAIYPIFESNDKFEGMYAKLAACIREKIENIEGYPQNICIKCKNTSDTICSFISKFEETCKILEKKIVQIKTEKEDSIDISDNDFDNEEDPQEFNYELQVDNLPVNPIPEKRKPTELLESLKHITVKKIKVNNVPEKDSVVVKKNGRPPKRAKASGNVTKTKKVDSKSTIAKKSATKPESAKLKEKVAATPGNNTVVDETAEKARREKNKIVKEAETKNTQTTTLCDACGELFEDKELLKRHIRKKHAAKIFKCPKCQKSYHSDSRLKEHLKTHEPRIHICELCGKSFSLKKVLNGHIRYVHQNVRQPPIKHKCQFCDRIFASKRCALIHERSVHTGERPEVCSVCDGRFYDIVYLKQHMLIHTGETPFKCPICSRGYSQRCNMKSHMRNHKISEQTPEILDKLKPNYLKFMRP